MNWKAKLMRIALLLASLLALRPVSAQIPSGFVQTTFTVPSVANWSASASWVNLSSATQLPLLGCVSTFPITVTGQVSLAGTASLLLADTSQICPTPSTWNIQLTCPAGFTGGFSLQVAVTGGGGTENISSQVSSALPASPCTPNGGGGGGGGGGSGTVGPGAPTQVAVYSATGTAVAGSDTIDVRGSITGAGVEDTNRPTVNTSSITTGAGGNTDEVSKLQQLTVNADAGVYTPNLLVSSLGTPNAVVTALSNQFFDSALYNSAGGQPYLSAGLMRLNLHSYIVNGETDVPALWDFEGLGPSIGGQEGVGTTINLSATATNLLPWGSSLPSTVLHLGPPLNGLGTAAFSLGNSARHLTVNGGSASYITCLGNYVGQQGVEFQDVATVGNCQIGMSIGGVTGFTSSGAVQNSWGANDVALRLAQNPSTNTITGWIITAAGSYTVPSGQYVVGTVTGCSVNPTVYGTVTGTSLTGLIAVGGFRGTNCPSTGVSISFATTYGSGATAVPIIGAVGNSIGLALGFWGGGSTGTFHNISNVATNEVNEPISGMTIDASQGIILDNTYVESALNGLDVGRVHSGSSGLISIRKLNVSPSQAPCNAAMRIFNNETIYGLDAEEFGGSCTWYLQDFKSNGGNIRRTQFNPDGVAQYIRDGWYVSSTNIDITSNLPSGTSYYNCNTSSDSGCRLPALHLPAQLINGHVSGISASYTGQPVGILSNSGRLTQVSTDSSTVADRGDAYCIFDTTQTTVTAGDGVYTSSAANVPIGGGQFEAGCYDGSSQEPVGQYLLGYIKNLGASGSLTVPTTPSTSGVTITQTGSPGTVSVSYELVQATSQDYSLSAPTSAITTTTSPAALLSTAGNRINGLSASAANPVWVYRTAVGETLPSVTVQCCTNGEATGVTFSGGFGVYWPPTITFSGGGCSTEPSGAIQVWGGSNFAIQWISNGVGCGGTITGTLTASTALTGYIGYTSTSTFNDFGQPGDNTTPTAGGQISAIVTVQKHTNLGTGSPVTGPGSSASGDAAVWNGATGSALSDGGPLAHPQAQGFCTGVAASSSTTLSLFNLGGGANTTCALAANASGVTAGFQMNNTGAVSNLRVRCSETGISSLSGVFTLYYAAPGASAGTATPLTVTYGTSAAYSVQSDTTHTQAYVPGGLFTIRYTTQASETLGDCSASFNYY